MSLLQSATTKAGCSYGFDQGIPRGLTASLVGQEVTEERKLKWGKISNGALLKLAEDAGFDLLLTTDLGGLFGSALTLLEAQ